MRVVLKTPVFVGLSENCGKDSLPPSHTINSQSRSCRLSVNVSWAGRELHVTGIRAGSLLQPQEVSYFLRFTMIVDALHQQKRGVRR
jgi:hypothetical protein